MNFLDMKSHVRSLREGSEAMWTSIWTFPGVHEHMSSKLGGCYEPFATLGTLMAVVRLLVHLPTISKFSSSKTILPNFVEILSEFSQMICISSLQIS